ncbi:unnamed protein product [Hyaloperonospora brassicae]|uniref:RxLR effector protein n=1 Tax=Hyaloperonospora brassicae TaxID=162125 RepID=A0AAV0T2M0_HYABA|nr:unnamed protein product [Hyaloperonospora brassicae]
MRLAFIAAAALAAVFTCSDALPTATGGLRPVLESNAAAVDRLTDGAFIDADTDRFLRAAQNEDDSVPIELAHEERRLGAFFPEKVTAFVKRMGRSPLAGDALNAVLGFAAKHEAGFKRANTLRRKFRKTGKGT